MLSALGSLSLSLDDEKAVVAWLHSRARARCMLGKVWLSLGKALSSSLSGLPVHVKAVGAWSWSRSAGTEGGLMEEGMAVRCGKPRLTEGVRRV